jgi:hypothetical protein
VTYTGGRESLRYKVGIPQKPFDAVGVGIDDRLAEIASVLLEYEMGTVLHA